MAAGNAQRVKPTSANADLRPSFVKTTTPHQMYNCAMTNDQHDNNLTTNKRFQVISMMPQ
jgi:hypothetical protein